LLLSQAAVVNLLGDPYYSMLPQRVLLHLDLISRHVPHGGTVAAAVVQ
jgi:hypothetical protein